MANVKITALTNLAAGDVADEDVFVIDDVSVPESKKVTVANLKVAIDTIATSNINTVSSNVDLVRSNVDSLGTYANTTFSTISNAASLAADIATLNTVDTATGTENRLNANLDIVQDNVVAAEANVVLVRSNTDSLGTYANTTFSTISNAASLAAAINLAGTDFNPQINLVQDNVTAVNNYITSNYATTTLLDSVQDNVASAESNVLLVRSNVDDYALYANTNFDTKANASATFTTLNTNIDTVSSNTDAVESRRVANIAGAVSSILTSDLTASRAMVTDSSGKVAVDINVSATELGYLNGVTSAIQPQISTIEADTGLNKSNLDNFASTTNTTIDTVSANLTANLVQIEANINTVQNNVTSNFNQLDANIDVVQTNVASITDGTTAFTGEVTMNDDLIVTGNLIVNGAQVDLGVTTATISNNLIELSAELGPTDTPTTDSGLLINRGNEGNVFIGKSVAEDGVVFAHTLSPDTNVTIAVDEFMDAHANAFHAAADASLTRVHFGLRAAEDTGIVIDDTGANINFAIDGAYKANVHYDGTLNSQNAVIAPAIYSGEVELRANDYTTYTTLDTRIDTVSSNADAIESRRTANIAGAISSVLTSDLTASRAVESDGSGKLSASSVTSTELGTLSGITASTAELNYNDITTLGTVQASKTVTADSSGEVLFPDSKSAKFGTGGDFTVQFDGTNALLTGPSSGEVRISTNKFQVLNTLGSETLFRSDAGSITNLYNAGTLKLQTIPEGIRVVGEMRSNNLLADANVTFGLNDSNTVTSLGTISAPAFTLNGADLESNLAALASGIAAIPVAGAFPTGDYGLLDSANSATDAFGETTADLDTFDMKTDPTGELATEDLGALS